MEWKDKISAFKQIDVRGIQGNFLVLHVFLGNRERKKGLHKECNSPNSMNSPEQRVKD